MTGYVPKFPFLVSSDKMGEYLWMSVWATDKEDAIRQFNEALESSTHKHPWWSAPYPSQITTQTPMEFRRAFDKYRDKGLVYDPSPY